MEGNIRRSECVWMEAKLVNGEGDGGAKWAGGGDDVGSWGNVNRSDVRKTGL